MPVGAGWSVAVFAVRADGVTAGGALFAPRHGHVETHGTEGASGNCHKQSISFRVPFHHCAAHEAGKKRTAGSSGGDDDGAERKFHFSYPMLTSSFCGLVAAAPV